MQINLALVIGTSPYWSSKELGKQYVQRRHAEATLHRNLILIKFNKFWITCYVYKLNTKRYINFNIVSVIMVSRKRIGWWFM